MGKVLAKFLNGFRGTMTRSVDNIVISLRNASGADLPYGAPVFLSPNEKACVAFDANTSSAAAFLGFAVRAADKTPEVYGSSESCFKANEPADILVRGSMVLPFANTANAGSSVYIRKSDGALVTSPGAEGTTLQLPNVTVRTARDTDHNAEVVILKRNLM